MIVFIVPTVTGGGGGGMSAISSSLVYRAEGGFQPLATMMTVMCGVPVLLPWLITGKHEA